MSHLYTADHPVAVLEAAILAQNYDFLAPREIDAFNVGLYERFATGPMFVAVAEVPINISKLLEAHSDRLCRGAQTDKPHRSGKWKTEHLQLLFELAPDLLAFVNANVSCIRVFARDRDLAERTVRDLAKRFRAKRKKKLVPPTFHLLAISGNLIDTTPVEVTEKVRRTEDQLSLLYGEEFTAWHNSLVATLRAKPTGTILLRGEPGVGKTSFIRHLFSQLNRTHRFYYLPATNFEVLASPSFTDFWRDQSSCFPKKQKVVVLEDAESLLADRGAGNRGPISNLLNVSDGLLGDFLKIQLVATVNCPISHLDPAIVRSGRLLACWEFKRLSHERAERIAAAHGLTLPPQPDYSLAEIFHGAAKTVASPARPTMGFGAR